MPGKWPWFERHFIFDFPSQKHPDIIERLRGTPARADELSRHLSAKVLTRRDGDSWSIQQNVGHLADLEPLWMGRIDDILAGVETMRPADLTNAATFSADHNERTLEQVLGSFREARSPLVSRLESLSAESFARSSIHPRTKIQMRVIDLCVFAADHDDYHLARISELKRKFA